MQILPQNIKRFKIQNIPNYSGTCLQIIDTRYRCVLQLVVQQWLLNRNLQPTLVDFTFTNVKRLLVIIFNGTCGE